MHPAAPEDLADETAPPLAGRGVTAAALGWLVATLLAERDRWPLWLPVLLGAGIGIYFWLPSEPPLWLGLVGLLIVAAVVVLAWRSERARVPAVAAAAIVLGFAAAEAQAWWVAAPVLPHRLFATTIEGRIVAVEPMPEGARLVIAPRRIEKLDPAHLPLRVRVKLRKEDPALAPGSWISLRATLSPPPAPAMPGAYDFQRRAYFDRLGAVGFALGGATIVPAPPGEGPSIWRGAVEAVRGGVTARIRAVLPGETGAVASALIAGETHAIAPADAGAFRDAGLAHILVIAGLHMGMVAGVGFFALRAILALIPPLALRFPTKKWAAGGTLLLIFGYMLLSGATVSSRRAFAQTGLVLLAVLVDRISLSARSVALAAAAILLMTPEAATGASFQMSFAAVAALIAFYEALQPRLSQWHSHAGPARRAGLYVVGVAFTTIVTTVATLSFTIFHFNRFPLYSVVANALAVPITGFWVMPWAIVACLLMPFHLEAVALVPMGWGIDAIAAIAHRVTSWPGAVLTVPSMPVGALLLVTLGGLWLCIWRRRWRWLGLAPIAAGYLGLLLVTPPDILVSDDFKIVAVRDAAGAYLPSTSHREAFLEETWTKHAATMLGPAWPPSGQAAGGALSCDPDGCVYRARGRTVALVRDGSALAEDCAASDLVVSPVAAHRACRGALIVDRLDTWRRGGHAIWLDGDRVRIETVRDWQGDRPWSPRQGAERPARDPLNIAGGAPPDDPEP
jgi:competence protein ComEC